ncbi:MAG: hypothetical protein ACAH89_15005 [Rariglobus sp.]|nr:hypothetical protein [Rariglobus sp.]
MKNSRPLLLSRPVVAVCLTIAFALAAGTATLSVFSIREVANVADQLSRSHGSLRIDDLERIENMITTRLSGPELFPGSDRAAMEELRRFLDASKAREHESLTARTALISERSVRFQLISFVMLGVAVVMTAVGFILFIRRVNELETMITVCAWTKRVKYNGKWVGFEDYLHNRFHLEFTHSISEDAAKKLMLEELELHPELRGDEPKR